MLLAASCGKSHKVAAKRQTTTSSSELTTTTTVAAATSTAAATTTTRRATTTGRPNTTAATPRGGRPVGVKLTRIASSLSQPLALAQAPNDSALYIAEQGGRVQALRNAQTVTVLDISTTISSGGERGLLGLAFAPNRSAMEVYYTAPNGDIHIDEYRFSGGAVRGGARPILSISHSEFANHNGGNLVFGPDGFLYAGTGDGGSGGDPHNHSQDPNSLLGKMLRIDPSQSSPQPQVWMIGLRNPWRFSFDRATGEMWIGDVGQDAWEEIDVAGAGTHGQNWGWNLREGKHPYKGAAPAGAVDPLYDYPHGGGVCAVTGGYVYRGAQLGGWGGTYLFADECVGRVMALIRNGNSASVRDTGLSTSQLASFGQDQNGEVFVLSLAGAVYRIDPV